MNAKLRRDRAAEGAVALDPVLNGMGLQRPGQYTVSLLTRDSTSEAVRLDDPALVEPLDRGDLIVICTSTECDRDRCADLPGGPFRDAGAARRPELMFVHVLVFRDDSSPWFVRLADGFDVAVLALLVLVVLVMLWPRSRW